VFDIESESRSPEKIAPNDPNYKKADIRSLLLAEVRLLFSMPAQITARSFYRSRQKCFIRMIEQRHAIKFFADEHCTKIEIHQRLKDHHGESAMSPGEVYRWIMDIKQRRMDLETISSPGKTPGEGLSEVMRHRIEAGPHLSARKIAHSLGIATSTVCHHLRYVLGRKCYHLRWIPHTLTGTQKVAREQVARNMLKILASHAASNFHFHVTGDESWLLDAYHVRTMQTLCPENVDQLQSASHITKKTMATVFFNGTGLHIIDILPQNRRWMQSTLPSILCRRCFQSVLQQEGVADKEKGLSTLTILRYTIHQWSLTNQMNKT
jgi:hypothetical protein